MSVCDAVHAGTHLNHVLHPHSAEWPPGGDVITVRLPAPLRHPVTALLYPTLVCVNRVNHWKSLCREIKEHYS